jgi:hypothetical protein
VNLWYETLDELEKVKSSVGEDNLTVDQKLKIVEIKALLAIGQDLNGLRLKDDQSFS